MWIIPKNYPGPNQIGAITEWGGKNNPHRTSGAHTKKLNPDWVEQLMGLVVGWTSFKYGKNRIDRLRLLGNGVVPKQAKKAYIVLFHKLNL